MGKNSDFSKESYRERGVYRDNDKHRGHRSYSSSRRSSEYRDEDVHHYSRNGDYELNDRKHRNQSDHRSYRNSYCDRDRRSRSRSFERNESNNNRFNYDSDNSRNNDRYEERDNYIKDQPEIPNHTLIIRNLPFRLTEQDVTAEINKFGLPPKEVRLMRCKETGLSRGFAFIEFATIEEAVQLKQLTQGILLLDDESECTLHYSFPKDAIIAERKNDWYCFMCGINNFKRRDECFKCGSKREDYDQNEQHERMHMTPTNALLLRKLSKETKEETILFQIGSLTKLPIKSIHMKNDGDKFNACLVEMHSIYEATELFKIIAAIPHGLTIDGHHVRVCYSKKMEKSSFQRSNNTPNVAMAALAAAQWKNLDDSSRTNKSLGTVKVDGHEYKKYEPPNYNALQYDANSGFYYDPSTGFYYDSKSQYFYNSQTQKYMYYDTANQIYISVDSNGNKTTDTESTVASTTLNKNAETTKSNDDSKADKAKMAKKIAKDMEKWAKTLNQKKDVSKCVLPAPETVPETENSQSSFNIVEKQQATSTPSSAAAASAMVDDETMANETPQFVDPFEIIKNEEEKLIDHERLACLLCKRQFNSSELLVKHQKLSELHKNNMSALRRTHLNDEQLDHMEKVERELAYRDRAKERREKYGIDDAPEFPKHKFAKKIDKKPMAETSVPAPPISIDNIGNRMLKAMGWTEGTGLGKSNQGMSGIIEVDRRKSGLGLGNPSAKLSSKESYKDAVRRTAFERFKEMNEKK